MEKRILSKVEKAKMYAIVKSVVDKKNAEAFKSASEELPIMEEKIGKLSKKQLASINLKYGFDPRNVLESLKIRIREGKLERIYTAYKSLKMII